MRQLLSIAAAALLMLLLPGSTARAIEPVRVAVETPTRQAVADLVEQGIDVARGAVPVSDVILWSAADRANLRRAGFEWRRLADPSPPARRSAPTLPSGRKTYRVWEEYEIEMRSLARRHPDLIRLHSMGRTRLGKPILGLEIASDVWRSDGRPAFVQYGAHHAREWPSAEWPMEYAIELVERRAEPRYADLLASTRHFIFPVINVDGFRASRGAGPSPIGAPDSVSRVIGPGQAEYRRKNCRRLAGEPKAPCSALFPTGGVDLNRNYGYYWGGTGTSVDPGSDLYRGPSAFSEPESRAVRTFTRKLQPTVLLSHHTYWDQGLWMRPPGFNDAAIFPSDESPDEAEFLTLSNSLAEATGWLSWKSFELYPVTGATDDWNYMAQASLALTSEGKGPDFHSYFDQMVRTEYPGISEALLQSAEASTSEGAEITGEAPPGARLTISKSFDIPTCSGSSNLVQCISPTPSLPEILTSKMVVPASGRFAWRVNPSSRPLETGEAWQFICRAPGGSPVTRAVTVGRGETAEVDLADCRPGPAGRPIPRFRTTERPIAGRRVVLVAGSTDPDSIVVSNRWDLDGDGAFDDAAGPVAALTWKRSGRKPVGLRSVDLDGNASVIRRLVRVVPRPVGRPPLSLRVIGNGEPAWSNFVFLANGPLGTYRWDLDGDGAFDDGQGRELSRSYRNPGTYRIRVRSTDTFGRTATRRATLTVR